MKRKLSIFLALTLLFTQLNAQLKVIAESNAFDEVLGGSATLVTMKNGSTVLLHFKKKKGIDIQIYGPTHRQKVVTTIEPEWSSLEFWSDLNVFEINNNLVLFVMVLRDKNPVLYRVMIDGNTGKIKEEVKVETLNKVGTMAFGVGFNTSDNWAYVRKDPASDNYAIVYAKKFDNDSKQSYEIVMYSGDHKETARGRYSATEKDYKAFRFYQMDFAGPDGFRFLTYEATTWGEKPKEAFLSLVTFRKATQSFTTTKIKSVSGHSIENAQIEYNPATKSLLCLGLEVTASTVNKTTYAPFLTTIDAETEKVSGEMPISLSEVVRAKSVEIFGKKDAFEGIPQGLTVHEDGSYSIVFEEMNQSEGTSTVFMELKHVAVIDYSKEGKEIESWFIPKRHVLRHMLSSPLNKKSLSDNTTLYMGREYKSFLYVRGPNRGYVILNDIEENAEKIEKGRNLTPIEGIADCDALYFIMGKNETMPKRQFLFGPPPSSNDHNLAMVDLVNYDPKTNILTMLKMERVGRDRYGKMVWVRLQ